MERVKKIICTVTNDLNYDQRMHRICSSLSTHGYEVLLIGRKEAHTIKLGDKDFQQKRLRSIFQTGFLKYAEYNVRLFFLLLFSKFDIINAVDLDSIVPSYLVAKLKGKKIVYDAHEYFTEVPELENRPMVKSIWEIIGKFFIKRVDRAYTVGAGLQKIFAERYKKEFSLIRNVPQSIQVNDSDKQKNLILYQGALNKGRGLEQMIDAMHKLPNYELWIIGEGDLSAALRARAKEIQNVKFLGHKLPADLKKITPKAWIGINLLENKGLSYYYSLANRTFDFIQAAVPAIHMNFPEYASINADHEIGVLIDELEIETIVQAVRRYEEPNFHKSIVENNRKAAQILTWEKEEKSLLKVYESLV